MKKLVLALAAMTAFTGAASAADLAARPVVKAPPPAPVASWTGCWISGGVGYQFDRINHEVWGGSINPGLRTQNISNDADGWLGTVGAGCDYQFSGRWVIGAFGDYSFSNIRGDYAARLTGPGDIGIGQIKSDWTWAIGGRVGYLVAPNVLTYVNGGFTQAHFKSVNVFDRIQNDGLFTGIAIGGQTLDGVFVGTGFEYSFDWLPGLFLKSEGRASWFQRKDAGVACVVAGSVCNGLGDPAFVSFNRDSRDIITYMAKTELVYRFNWGSPVVAKY